MKRRLLFRVTAAVVAVYHILLGVLGVLAPQDLLHSSVQAVMGVDIEKDSAVMLVSEFAAVYMFAFGVMVGFLAWRPRRYAVLVWPAVILFVTRGVHRLIIFNDLSSEFGMPVARNIVGTVMLFGFAFLLWWLRPRKD